MILETVRAARAPPWCSAASKTDLFSDSHWVWSLKIVGLQTDGWSPNSHDPILCDALVVKAFQTNRGTNIRCDFDTNQKKRKKKNIKFANKTQHKYHHQPISRDEDAWNTAKHISLVVMVTHSRLVSTSWPAYEFLTSITISPAAANLHSGLFSASPMIHASPLPHKHTKFKHLMERGTQPALHSPLFCFPALIVDNAAAHFSVSLLLGTLTSSSSSSVVRCQQVHVCGPCICQTHDEKLSVDTLKHPELWKSLKEKESCLKKKKSLPVSLCREDFTL